MDQLNDMGTAILAIAAWLLLAVPVRLAGGRALAYASAYRATSPRAVLAAARRGLRRLERRGWSGRHGLPGSLVTAVQRGLIRVPELEDRAPRPEVTDVNLADTGPLSEDEQQHADEMHALVEEFRAEAVDETARPSEADPATVDREPLVRVLQERTAEVDLFLFAAARDTRAEFDALVAGDKAAAARLAAAREALLANSGAHQLVGAAC